MRHRMCYCFKPEASLYVVLLEKIILSQAGDEIGGDTPLNGFLRTLRISGLYTDIKLNVES